MQRSAESVSIGASCSESDRRVAGSTGEASEINHMLCKRSGRVGNRQDVGETGSSVVRHHELGGTVCSAIIGNVEAHRHVGVVLGLQDDVDVLLVDGLVSVRPPGRGVTLTAGRYDGRTGWQQGGQGRSCDVTGLGRGYATSHIGRIRGRSDRNRPARHRAIRAGHNGRTDDQVIGRTVARVRCAVDEEVVGGARVSANRRGCHVDLDRATVAWRERAVGEAYGAGARCRRKGRRSAAGC